MILGPLELVLIAGCALTVFTCTPVLTLTCGVDIFGISDAAAGRASPAEMPSKHKLANTMEMLRLLRPVAPTRTDVLCFLLCPLMIHVACSRQIQKRAKTFNLRNAPRQQSTKIAFVD